MNIPPDDLKTLVRRFYGLGFNVTTVTGKSPAPDPWVELKTRRQTPEEVANLTYTDRTGLGAISCDETCIRCIDFDDKRPGSEVNYEAVRRFLAGARLPSTYKWVVKSGKGYHVWIVAPDMPHEISDGRADNIVFKVSTNGLEDNGHMTELEVRWRQHTVLPFSVHPDTGHTYTFVNSEDIPDLPPSPVTSERLLDGLMSAGVILSVKDYVNTTINLQGTVTHTPTATPSDDVTAILELYKANDSALLRSYLKDKGITDGYRSRPERSGWERISTPNVGMGGIFLKPSEGLWYSMAQEIGGSIFHAAHLAKHGAWSKSQGKGLLRGSVFVEALQEAAQYAGYELRPQAERTPMSVRADEQVTVEQSEQAETDKELLEYLRIASMVYIPSAGFIVPVADPIVTFCEVPIARPGDIMSIIASPGAGKSSLCSALTAAFINPDLQRGYALGFGIECRHVMYFDTEQSAYDHQKQYDTALRRSRYSDRYPHQNPPNVTWGSLLKIPSNHERMEFILATMSATDNALVIIDGVGDLMRDVNNPEETTDLVARMFAKAEEMRHAIIVTLHPNPNSEKKPRGHIGSECLRKSKAVITIEKDAETKVRLITTGGTYGKNRGGADDLTTAMQWDDDARMFLECPVPSKGGRKSSATTRAIDDLFGSKERFHFSELVQLVSESLGITEGGAKAKVSRWLNAGHLKKNPGGFIVAAHRSTDETFHDTVSHEVQF